MQHLSAPGFPANDWQWPGSPEEFARKYFHPGPITDSGIPMYVGGPDDPDTPNQIEQLRNRIDSLLFSYVDKNRNKQWDIGEQRRNLLRISVFISTDGAWLLRQAKEFPQPARDELVLFVEVSDKEHSDSVSGNVLLCKGGEGAAAYFNDKTLTSWLGSLVTLSGTEIEDLIRRCADKDAFLDGLRSVISAAAHVVTFLPAQVGKLLCWLGEGFEQLTISESTWNSDKVSELVRNVQQARDYLSGWLDEKANQSSFELFGISIPMPEWLCNLIRRFSKAITPLFSIIETVAAAIGKFLELRLALFCGVLNGLIDLVGGTLSFFGTILKMLAGAVEGAVEVGMNEGYYSKLLLEYIDNFTQALGAVNWGKVVRHIIDTMEKVYDAVSNAKFSINSRQVCYYIGYIGINILACFVGVGEIAAITRINRLKGPMMTLLEMVSNTVGQLPKAARNAMETMYDLFSAYIRIVANGTMSVIGHINTVFEVILKWLAKLGLKVFMILLRGQLVACDPLLITAFIKMMARLAARRIRNNLERLGMEVWVHEDQYFLRYGDEVICQGKEDDVTRFVSENLEREEAEARQWLDDAADKMRKMRQVNEEMRAKGAFNEEKDRLQKLGINVPVSENGLAPDFSSLPHYLYGNSVDKSIVKIKLTGNRDADYEAAFHKLGIFDEATQKAIKKDYTWHHFDDYNPITDTSTMQLVQKHIHVACYPHKGSFRQRELFLSVK